MILLSIVHRPCAHWLTCSPVTDPVALARDGTAGDNRRLCDVRWGYSVRPDTEQPTVCDG